MQTNAIPSAVITVVADVLAGYYYSYRRLNALFAEAGAPGDAPAEASCNERCLFFLKRSNEDPDVDAFAVLGAALIDLMEVADESEQVQEARGRITKMLTRYGLRYEQGGHVRGHLTATPSRTFEEVLRRHDYSTVEAEFRRAMDAVESDPATALTAACATLESICLVYIEDEKLEIPAKKDLGHLWLIVKASLKFDPKAVADDDLKKILGGIASIVDGVAAFRTHAGSAHGRERGAYKPKPRHARLGVHAAHTLAAFIIETWDERKGGRRREALSERGLLASPSPGGTASRP